MVLPTYGRCLTVARDAGSPIATSQALLLHTSTRASQAVVDLVATPTTRRLARSDVPTYCPLAARNPGRDAGSRTVGPPWGHPPRALSRPPRRFADHDRVRDRPGASSKPARRASSSTLRLELRPDHRRARGAECTPVKPETASGAEREVLSPSVTGQELPGLLVQARVWLLCWLELKAPSRSPTSPPATRIESRRPARGESTGLGRDPRGGAGARRAAGQQSTAHSDISAWSTFRNGLAGRSGVSVSRGLGVTLGVGEVVGLVVSIPGLELELPQGSRFDKGLGAVAAAGDRGPGRTAPEAQAGPGAQAGRGRRPAHVGPGQEGGAMSPTYRLCLKAVVASPSRCSGCVGRRWRRRRAAVADPEQQPRHERR
jgi:hypothetical protein